MGFGQQLRILLWKNFLLKKRSPGVTSLELFLPLFLFAVLVIIRDRSKATSHDSGFTPAYPLFSAGFTPVLQMACPAGAYDEHGFRKQDKSIFNEVLATITRLSDAIAEAIPREGGSNHLQDIIHTTRKRILMKDQGTQDEPPPWTHGDMEKIYRQIRGVMLSPDTWAQVRNLQQKIDDVMAKDDPEMPQQCVRSEQLPVGPGDDSKRHNNASDSIAKDIEVIWRTMRAIVCDPDEDEIPVQHTPANDTLIAVGGLIRMLLSSNPRILYAPTNTQADDVISEIIGTLGIIPELTRQAQQWLKISDSLRDTINRTIHDPVSSHQGHPYGQDGTPISTSLPYNVSGVPWGTRPRPRSTTQDPRVPIADGLLAVLDVVDWIACVWLNVARDNLDFVHWFKGFRTEREIEKYFLEDAYKEGVTVLASIIFDVRNDGTLHPQTIYKIRQNATFTPPTRHVRDMWYDASPNEGSWLYYLLGFVWLQDLVERAIITTQLGFDVIEPGLYLQTFPQPCYLQDDFPFIIEHMVPLAMMLSWLLPVAMLTRAVVYEKENRLKEMTKMMGVSNGAHWSAWIITAIVYDSLIMALITVLLVVGRVLSYTNGLLIFVVLEIYAFNAVFYSLFISVIFKKTKIAAAVGGIIFLVTYVPYMYISMVEGVGQKTPVWGKCLASLMGTTSFGLFCKYLGRYEDASIGLQWNNLLATPLKDEGFNGFLAMIMGAAGTLVYGVLIWYIDNVFPGDFGQPKRWYFFATQSCWCGADSNILPDTSERRLMKLTASSLSVKLQNFEREPQHLTQTINISNLTKVYSNDKTAVDGLNLNLFEGQILSFLGHNGAGKTTTMSMLTGMIPASSGQVRIHDYNINNQMDKVRNILGFCPQHNVLFDSLSVTEHLEFYASIKGLSQHAIQEEIASMLEDIGLSGKKHAAVSTLSGGMKRKLSIGIAFIAGSRVIVLDEPTAGVDPFSRREIWDLLLKYKHGRTIMLSTHHMDEADVLGDRIAVISQGVLLCSGSSLFLKSTLGEGYHLTIVKSPDTGTRSSHSGSLPGMSNSQRITVFLQNHVTGSYLKNESTQELRYILPFSGLQNGEFPLLFAKLDLYLDRLGILSYGVSDTKLEEVFLKVISDAKDPAYEDENNRVSIGSQSGSSRYDNSLGGGSDVAKTHRRNKSDGGPKKSGTMRTRRCLSWDSNAAKQYMQLHDDREPIHRQESEDGTGAGRYVVEGLSLVLQQYQACFIKRLTLFARSWKALLAQILLPVVFVAIAMVMAIVGGANIRDEPPIVLSTSQFLNLSKMANGHFVPMCDERQYDTSVDADVSELMATMKMVSGIGADCSLRSPFLGPNSTDFAQTCFDLLGHGNIKLELNTHARQRQQMKPFDNETSYFPDCECTPDKRGLQCSTDYARPPQLSVVTTDVLQNVTLINVTEFLFNTGNDYKQSRYGALSFGLRLSHVPEWLGYIPLDLGRIVVGKVAKVWHHTHGYHAMPIFVNAMNNAVFRANVPRSMGNPAGYGIIAINHPMNGTTSIDYASSVNFSLGGSELIVAIFVTLGMAFIPSTIALSVVQESSIQAKHLQHVSGMRPGVYWTSNLLLDLVVYQVPAWMCIAVFRAFNIQSFTAPDNFRCIILIVIFYGVGTIPMTYICSFLFREPSAAFVFVAVFNVFTGVACLSITFIVQSLGQEDLTAAGDWMKDIFLIFPGFALGSAFMDVAINHVLNQFRDVSDYQSPMDFQIVGKSLVALTAVGVVCFIITLLAEYRFFIPARLLPTRKLPDIQEEEEDADVSRERYRVLHGDTSSDVVRITDLTKIYHNTNRGQHVAVNRLTLGIPSGECFGMLGVNGAGKTTTFKMLTGDHAPSGGTAHIAGRSILTELHQVRQRIGYCPQFDALFDEMTAREHLYLYARLRGIPPADLATVVDWAISRLELDKYADRLVGTYSGGNKRKLSTAIALLGKPRVIFLDEPTAGMDPYAKRFLWSLIKRLVRQGRSIVLTSHSMEECETLCDRLAIMVDGQFRCLGSVQHLKSQYGDGYTIKITIKGPDIAASVSQLAAFMNRYVPAAKLKEQHYKTLQYEVASRHANVSNIFRHMEVARHQLPVEDYSVSQNTLDSVFISFIGNQGKPETEQIALSSGANDVELAYTHNTDTARKSAMELATLDDIRLAMQNDNDLATARFC